MLYILHAFWKKTWKFFFSISLGIALGISLTTHFYSVWGKSLLNQLLVYSGLGVMCGILIYWIFFISRYVKELNLKSDRFWPQIIVAVLLLNFITIPSVSPLPSLRVEIEVLENSPEWEVGISSIIYGKGNNVSFQELVMEGDWRIEGNRIIGRNPGSIISFPVVSETYESYSGEVKVFFTEVPESGFVLIRMDGVNRLVELKGGSMVF